MAVVAAVLLLGGRPGPAHAGVVPVGFQDNVVLSGLNGPVNVRFASDGRVFVAQRNGVLKVFPNLSTNTASTVIDLSGQVHNYWDRGMLGLALDPNFPATPYVYVLYTYNAQPGGTAPQWPTTNCPTPPGANTDGCVVSGKLVRLTLSGNTVTDQKTLIQNQWCQQFPSHSIGDLNFGADGALYISGGDGASFNYVDYGQSGGSAGSPIPKNPCGDPPAGSGGTMTPPTAEGGALRSQSVRRPSGEPVLLNGSVLRVDPATGDALPTNPLFGSSDANARRIVAYGFRNPFRFTVRPLTNELWIGDVGWNTWEEINRQPNPTSAAMNFGWPCYEGNSPQPGYQSTGLNLCSSLYSAGTATAPYFTYNHSSHVVSGDSCPTGNSSTTGLAFYTGASNYPAFYNNGLFFADYARQCIWFMPAGTNGLPDPAQIQQFDVGAPNPVDLEIGPNGNLFYPDIFGGTIREITYQPDTAPDLARGQPTSASTSETAALSPDKAVDGDSSTRWSSTFADNQWWQVDLGSVKPVDQVKLNWEAAYASTYRIQVSTDGSTFTTVATVNNTAAGWKTTSFTETSARYVRVLGVTRATPYGISFFDAQVFDQGSGGGGVPTNVAAPNVSGSPSQGQTLTATNGGWTGSPTSYRYQWQQCDTAGANCQPIAAATSQTYVVASTDVGKTLRVLVTATNASGDSQPAASAVTAVVSSDLALNQPASASSTEAAGLEAGKANDGDSTTRWSSAWSDNQWWQVDLGSAKQVDTVKLNWETAYASTYRIQLSTDGSTFTTVATVNAASPGWKTTTFTETTARYVRVLGVTRATVYGISFWDAQVSDSGSGGGGGGTVPANTALPSVTGFAGQGQTLTSTTGTWSNSPTSYAYQWQRCDTSGAACQPIAGATAQTYLLAAADAGKTVRSSVTATNASGNSQPASSAATPVVRADLALAKTASASSSESATFSPDKANDGNSTTRWASTFADNQWWQVDLGSSKQIDTVILNWEAGFASSYRIQVSTNGTTFTTVATENIVAPGWETTTFTGTSARYVRVFAVTRATPYGVSFFDAQVFAPVQGNAPTPVIDTPASTVTWKVGDLISFSGHATDPQQGNLPASALTWQLLLHHCDSTGQTCHIHSLSTFDGVASGSFNAPDHDYPSYLELDLTATDSQGLSTTTSMFLQPQTVDLTLATAPTGLQAAIDATSQATPYTVTVIVGSSHSLSAPNPQTLGGTTYTFASWSDGGAASHNITAPATATTYTATYTGGGGNTPPTAVATATSPTSGNAPLTVGFDGSGSSDPDAGDTITYSWDLNGDGTFGDSTAQKPSFTYTTQGTYNAVLRVTDNHSASTLSSPITITVSASPPPSVFGTTTPGNSNDAPSANWKEVSKFTAPVAGNVVKVTGYISGQATSSGSQPIRAVMYAANSSGNPGALLGVSNEVTVVAGQSYGWVDFTFPSPVAVQPGLVYMGYIVGAPTKKRVIQLKKQSISGDQKYNLNSGGYAAGPSNPFGNASTANAHYSIYATYG